MSPFLAELKLNELDEKDMEWLVVGCKVMPSGAEPYHIMMDLAHGKVRCFRLGEHTGILVIKVLQHPAFRELFIFLLAGEGVFDILEEAFPELEQLAKDYQCSKIGCWARKGLEKVLGERLDFKAERTYCVKEV